MAGGRPDQYGGAALFPAAWSGPGDFVFASAVGTAMNGRNVARRGSTW